MGNDSDSKIIRIEIIKVRIFYGIVRMLSKVNHVPKSRRSLNFFKGFGHFGL